MRIINHHKFAPTFGVLVVSCLAIGHAGAVSNTYTGMFTADNDVQQYTFSLPTTEDIDIYTTSYGGGTNLDGTTSSAGGFVPALTLYSVATGQAVDCAAAGTTCSGPQMPTGFINMDTTTGMTDDAFLAETLAAGNYVVDLTEDPNVATGDLANPNFLFSMDPTATGDVCGVTGGMFLETDTATCIQRSGNFSLNIGSVPEPATLWLALPVLVLGFVTRKRLQARS